MDNRSVPGSARTTIRIDDVDLAKRTIHGIDNKGGRIQAGWTVTGTSFQIPAQGDVWTMIRHGNIWHLEARFDTPDESAIKQDMAPGDVHIRTPGKVTFDSDTLHLASGPVASTTYDSLVATGSTTTFRTSGRPIQDSTVMVYVNGALLHPGIDYLVSASLITFTTPLSIGNKLTVYYQRQGTENRNTVIVRCQADFSRSLSGP